MERKIIAFGFKAEVHIVTTRKNVHMPTEKNYIMSCYPSSNQAPIKFQCKLSWEDNTGARLGYHTTGYYEAAPDDASKQFIISHKCLRSKKNYSLYQKLTYHIFKVKGQGFQ